VQIDGNELVGMVTPCGWRVEVTKAKCNGTNWSANEELGREV